MLVEPPMAMSITIAFENAFLVAIDSGSTDSSSWSYQRLEISTMVLPACSNSSRR